MADRKSAGFSLVEILVSLAVFTLLLSVMAVIVGRTGTLLSYTRGKIEQFRETREAFESLTRYLSEATLNTYLDYEDKNGNPRSSTTAISFVPVTYARQSELRFICGPKITGDSHSVFFQAPFGITRSNSKSTRTLNTVGYYVEFGSDGIFLPDFITQKKRFRLMQLIEPTESLSVYDYTTGTASAAQRSSPDWFAKLLTQSSPPVQIVAENVISLTLLPMLPPGERKAGNYYEYSLAPNYSYDSTVRRTDPNLNSRNQLPPLIRVTMIAIDDKSAVQLGDSGQEAMQSFLSSKFQTASQYDTDLQDVEQWLINRSINYRVFTTNVNMRNAKWGREP